MAKAATKPKPKPPEPTDVVEYIDCEQNSQPWLEARRGIITASNFKIVMREGKDGNESITRKKYLYTLAGEILSGQIAEKFKSEAMKRGNEMEAEAAEYYEKTTFEDVRRVGFVKRTIPSKIAGAEPLIVGASPDRLVGSRGGLEIKTMAPDLLIEHDDRGIAPTEHRAQIHGTMWICGLEHLELLLFYRGIKVPPKYKFFRDDVYIQEIRNAVELFDYDLKQLVKNKREKGW